MGEDVKLLLCPFCGSKHPLKVNHNGLRNLWWVVCDNYDCIANGPSRPSQSDAIAAWNTRVSHKEGENG